jgi:hypothetical protein
MFENETLLSEYVQSISKLPFLSIRPVDVTAGGHFDNVNVPRFLAQFK